MLGWTAMTVAAAITGLLAARHRQVAGALAAAFIARAMAALFHYYVMLLPGGRKDAVTFELKAWLWGQNGFFEAWANFPGINSYSYSWLLGLLYSITDRSLLMLQATSVLAGVLGVFFGWKLASQLWDRQSAHKAAWVMALFPTMVQYSAITMREAWIVLLFVLGLIGALRWARHGGSTPLFGALVAFLGATFFHGAMFVAALALLGLVSAKAARRLLHGLPRGRVNAFAFLGIIGGSVLIGGYVASGLSLPKLGTAAEAVDVERLTERFARRASMEDAGARYGSWQVPSEPYELLWIAPAKSIYFLFSPFPWDLRAPKHIIALVDALLYIVLALFAWRIRKRIWNEPGTRTVFLLFLTMVFVFGVGTGNFGTALRHRAKFAIALIALAAPKIPKIVMNIRSKAEDPKSHQDATPKQSSRTPA